MWTWSLNWPQHSRNRARAQENEPTHCQQSVSPCTRSYRPQKVSLLTEAKLRPASDIERQGFRKFRKRNKNVSGLNGCSEGQLSAQDRSFVVDQPSDRSIRKAEVPGSSGERQFSTQSGPKKSLLKGSNDPNHRRRRHSSAASSTPARARPQNESAGTAEGAAAWPGRTAQAYKMFGLPNLPW